MFKAEIHNDTTDDILTMADLKPCQLAVVVEDNNYRGTIVMRTASISQFEVMDLSNPGEDNCWTGKGNWMRLRLLPKGTKVTLTVI